MAHSQFHLFGTRRFLPLFITQFTGLFVDFSFKYAFITWITLTKFTSNTTHAALWANLIPGLYSLPVLLFSATAGKMADKFNRVYLARWTKLLELVLILLGGLGFWTDNIPLLAITLFLLGTHTAIFGPVKYSLLPALLEQQELLGGNGLIMAGTLAALLLGTMIGVYVGGGMQGPNRVCLIGAMVAVIGLGSSFVIPPVPRGDPNTKLNLNFLADIIPIVRVTMAQQVIAFSILAITWLVFVMVGITRQLPVFAKIVGGDQRLMGLLLGMCVLGVITGALLCNWFLKSKVQVKYVPLALAGMIVCTLDLSYTTFFMTARLIAGLHPVAEFLALAAGKRVCLDLFFLSVAASLYIVPLFTLIQVATLPEKRGRTFACNNIFASISGALAALIIMGMIKMDFSAAHVFLTIALLSILVIPCLWKFLPSNTLPLNCTSKTKT